MITIIIILLIYICMIFSVKYRTAIASLGIGVLLIYTALFKNYSSVIAFKSFPLEIVLLILVLALFSKIFENNGLLKILGDKLLKASKGKKLFIIIILPFTMYAISLFMNNLSVVLIFTFISLTIVREFKLPVIPILVAGLISSNIGGCPLPWADTPAVILTLYSDFTLWDFLSKLFLPCLFFELLLIGYIFIWYKYIVGNKHFYSFIGDSNFRDGSKKHMFILKPSPVPPLPKDQKNPPPPYEAPPHIKMLIPKSKFKRFYLPLIIFAIFILCICIAPFVNISIAYVCMFFLGCTLLILSRNPIEILNSLSIIDSLVFISALFMISGVLENLGILKAAVNYILLFTGDNKIFIILCILFCSFIISTFLSAGPAAATILPICIQLQPVIGSNFIFAALALGILAGSSMLPWSATGGPIMLSEVNRYLNHYTVSPLEQIKIKSIFILKNYILFSVPFSLIILLFSSLYLIVCVSI